MNSIQILDWGFKLWAVKVVPLVTICVDKQLNKLKEPQLFLLVYFRLIQYRSYNREDFDIAYTQWHNSFKTLEKHYIHSALYS